MHSFCLVRTVKMSFAVRIQTVISHHCDTLILSTMSRPLFSFLPIFAGLSMPLAAQISRGPYVQMATPDSMHLVWRMRKDIKPIIHFGTSSGKLDQQCGADKISVSKAAEDGDTSATKLFAAPPETRQYTAKVGGLKPNTKYFYRIDDGTEPLTPESEDYHFTTAPPVGTAQPLTLWVVGDSGTGNKAQASIHTVMVELMKQEKKKLDGYLHMGDMAYGSGLDSEFQGFFFESYAATLRNTVIWPTLGNHEGRTSKTAQGVGPYYDAYIVPTKGEAGGVPTGTEGYYSFDIGNVHIISLNSFDVSRQPTGPMAQWLKADLEKTKAAWVLAMFHHPPYTKGSHDSDHDKSGEMTEMRSLIMPILEAGGVDLVLNGHSHIYERSMLIDGAYDTPATAPDHVYNDGDGNPSGDGAYKKSVGITANNGTIVAVSGHGGAALGKKAAPHPLMKYSIVEFGSMILEIKEGTLLGRMLATNGEIMDTFQIDKAGVVKQTRIAAPKPPTPFGGKPIKAGKKAQSKEGDGMPPSYTEVIPKASEWDYLLGTAPDAKWTSECPANAKGWVKAKMGLGYSDEDDTTVITGMQGVSKYLCARRMFDFQESAMEGHLALAMRHDDGFICYINGQEVIRTNVESGSLATAMGTVPHEATSKFKIFPIPVTPGLLKKTGNVIAIEIHNDDLNSSDLTLDPFLIVSRSTGESVVHRSSTHKKKLAHYDGSEMPTSFFEIVPRKAEWQYRGGSAPEADWNTVCPEHAKGWLSAKMALGYGDDDDDTLLTGMRDVYRFICVRKSFDIPAVALKGTFGLAMRHDDGFVCYINGKEVGRMNVSSGSLATAQGTKSYEAPENFRYFPLNIEEGLLKKSGNIIAIEVHNDDLGSSDLTLDPALIVTGVDVPVSATTKSAEPDTSD